MSSFEDVWTEQLALFEQQLTKDISFKECLELQMEILENGKKPEERNNLNVSSKKSEVEDQVSEDRVGTVPEEKKKRMKKSYVVTDIPCNFCPNVFGSKATIKIHSEMNHIKLRFHCTFCEWSTKERYGMKYHLGRKHGRSEENFKEEAVLECGICSYRGLDEQYQRHIAAVHPEFKFTLSGEKHRTPIGKGPVSCEFCGLTYEDKYRASDARNIIRVHIAGVHMRCRYKCRLCEYTSPRKQEVYRHLRREHSQHETRSNTSYVCSLCPLETDTFLTMLSHMKLNHPDFLVREKKRKLEGRKRGKVGAWSCTECEYRTSNIFNLRDHTMRLHLSSLFTCQLCQVRFSNRTAAVTHVRQDHGKLFEEKYRGWARKFINNACKSCGFEGTCESYDEHLSEVHKMARLPPQRSGRTSKKPEGGDFICRACDSSFRLGDSLKRHIGSVHISLRYSCKICKKSVGSNLAIAKHVKTLHQGELERDVTVSCGKCDIDLGYDFRHTHLMKEHRDLYSRRRKERERTKGSGKKKSSVVSSNLVSCHFKDYFNKGSCKLCQSSVKSSEEEGHILDHLKATFLCSENDGEEVQYSRHGILRHLMSAHQAPNMSRRDQFDSKVQIRCGLCQYQASPPEFSQHPNHHRVDILQEKGQCHSCQLCDFRHLSSKKLRLHLAGAHGISPFPCGECPFKGNSLKGLVDHRQSEHPNFRYRCDPCNFSSKNYAAFCRHSMEQHQEVEWLPCTFCERKFKRKSNLLDHSQRVHGSKGEYS